MTTNKVVLVFAILMTAYQILLPAVKAQAVDQTSSDPSSNLDLASTDRTVTAGNGQNNFSQATILVGGNSKVVTAGSLLTPAENIALMQVLGSGNQTLVIDSAGRAVGGSFNLTANNLIALSIPLGVSALRDFAQSGSMTILGNLNNSGSLFAVSTNTQVTSGLISAQNVFNSQGALISSILPDSSLTNGFSNLLTSLSLQISAVQNIVNYGNITSSANLSLSAGNSIVNALPVGMSGPNPIIQAFGQVDIVSASLQNAGLISSLNSNINLASQIMQNFTINSTSGCFEAINGSINVRDQIFQGKYNTDIIGGDWIAKELNIFSGSGYITGNFNSVSGQLNIIGGDAQINAQAGDLHIGALVLSGDPSINTPGDIFLERSTFGGDWIFPGSAPVSLNAGGNIINVDVSNISTSGLPGTTGTISLVAGGNIDLQSAPLTSISTAAQGGNAGQITISAGKNLLLSTISINSSSTTGLGGNINISASNISANGLVSINSSSGQSKSGSIAINATNSLNLNAGLNATSTSNTGSGNFSLASTNGALNVAGLSVDTSSISGNAGAINLSSANSSINLGNLLLNSSSASANGGSIAIIAGGGAIDTLATDISARAANSFAGNLQIISNKNGINLGQGFIDLSGNNGGSIFISTLDGKADISLSGVDLKTSGKSGQISGDVSIFAGQGNYGSVLSSNIALKNIDTTGGIEGSGAITLISNYHSVSAKNLSTNGGSITISSGTNLAIDSILNSSSGQGGSILISSNNMASPSDTSENLTVNRGNGTNAIGFISSNAAGDGGIISLTNHGLGTVELGSISVNSSLNGGILVVVSDGDVNLNGNINVNGGLGNGGIFAVSAANSILAENSTITCNANIDGQGGTVNLTAGNNITSNNLTINTNGAGAGFAGAVSLSALTIDGSSLNINAVGGGLSGVSLTGDIQTQNLNINATGGLDTSIRSGGLVQLNCTNGLQGKVNVDVSGAINGSGGTVSISSLADLSLISGNIVLSANGGTNSGDGGNIALSSGGSIIAQADAFSVMAKGNGSGGNLSFQTGLDQNLTSNLSLSGTFNLDGNGTGGGGSFFAQVNKTVISNGDLSLSNANNLLINARSGANGGNGGNVTLVSQGNLSLSSTVLSLEVRAASGNGGNLVAIAGSDQSGTNVVFPSTLTLSGDFIVDAKGNGKGGNLSFTSSILSLSPNLTLSSNSEIAGSGGNVSLICKNSTVGLNLESISIVSRGGSGGNLTLTTGANLNIDQASVLDVSSLSASAGSGGKITLSAGQGGSGSLSLAGQILAESNGTGNGGNIFLNSSSTSINIGQLSLDGSADTLTLVSTSANSNGKAGDITINNNQATNLNLSGKLFASANNLSDMGQIIIKASNNQVNLNGVGSLRGYLNGDMQSFNAQIAGVNTALGVQNLSSSAGNILLKTTSIDSQIVFASGSNLSSKNGSISLSTSNLKFLGDSTLAMNSGAAGIFKIDSGLQSNPLNIDFGSGNINFNLVQGASARPGNFLISPSGSSALNLSGSANVNFDGGTVSLSTSASSINIQDSNLSLNSTAFDNLQSLGMEIIATNGDINLNGNISARQLNINTISSGNINLGGDLSAPTVFITVDGNSNINQVGNGVIGVGSLVLSSLAGNVGSISKAIQTDVLELKVQSGAGAYVNNASSLDLRTTNVSSTFQLSNQGDISVLGPLSAGNLDIVSNDNISIFDNVNGINGISLSTSNSGNLSISNGAVLNSTNGNISINTANLVLDGSVQTSANNASVIVNSVSDLNLSGNAGQISASGSNSFIGLFASNKINFANSYSLNAGSSGIVQVQTANTSSGLVSLNNSTNLNIGGASQLNIFTNNLSLSSGSSISLSKSSGTAMLLACLPGTGLNVILGGSSANISSAGGNMEIRAGFASPLTFSNNSLNRSILNFSGGLLLTETSSADTTLNNVTLANNGDIQINVHGAQLNLDGDINSSKNGGVIVLQDPNGITLTGNGNVGFINSASGNILVEALGQGSILQFNGKNTFSSGVSGSVTFSSQGSIIFAPSSQATLTSGNNLTVTAPQIIMGDASTMQANGSANINISGIDASGLNFIVNSGAVANVVTNGGQILISGGVDSAPVSFSPSSISSGASLLLTGGESQISTNNANVTVNSGMTIQTDHDLSILTPGASLINNGQILTPSSTTTIQAAGDLVIDKNISANSLVIQTIANNGNITLSSDVNVVNALKVSANGSGNIIQTGGLLSAASISLISGSGNIGTKTSPIRVNTPVLNISTAGAANVHDLSAVNLASFAVGSGLNLRAEGNILVGGNNTSSLNFTSNSNFNAGKNGLVSLSANDSINIANNVKVASVGGSSLLLNTNNLNLGSHSRLRSSDDLSIIASSISLGQNSKISSAQDLQILANISGADFRLSSGNAFSLTGDLNGRSVELRSQNGNMTLDGHIKARDLDIDLKGKSSLIQNSGLIESRNLEISSEKGDIGSLGHSINLLVDNLEVETGSHGRVNLYSQGNLNLANSRSGGDFNLQSEGSVTLNDLETKHGSISVVSSGSLLKVNEGSKIIANEGNLTLQNTSNSLGKIIIGKNAELGAYTASSQTGLGQVKIVVGAIPDVPVKGSIPSGLKLSERWGGQAYFGQNGILVQGKNNKVNAWGSNVIFSTGSLSKEAIVLEGGVNITADPPPSASFAFPVSHLNESHISAKIENKFASNDNSVANYSSTNLSSFDTKQQYISSKGKSFIHNKTEDFKNRIDESVQSSESNKLLSIAMLTEFNLKLNSDSNLFVPGIRNKMNSAACSAHLYTVDGKYSSSSHQFSLAEGENLLVAQKELAVEVAGNVLNILPGSVVFIIKDNENFEIYNLYEKNWGASKIRTQNKEFILGVGQKFAVGKQILHVANRKIKEHYSSKDNKINTAEFSLMSLIAESKVFKNLIQSSEQVDKQVANKILKMAACLQVVTSSHGPYKN